MLCCLRVTVMQVQSGEELQEQALMLALSRPQGVTEMQKQTLILPEEMH